MMCLITLLYLSSNLLSLALLAWFVVACYRERAVFSYRIGLTFVLIYCFEYEVGREIARLCGCFPVIGPLRLLYLRFLYCLTGFFLREVLLYAQHKFTSLDV